MSSHEEARSFVLQHQGVSSEAISLLDKGALVKVLDNDQGVERQFGSCRLGNSLRTKRLQKIATQMLSQPEQSLPQQNPDWADLKAAYRFFDSKGVTFTAIAEQHWRQTRETKPGRYLPISDTTDID